MPTAADWTLMLAQASWLLGLPHSERSIASCNCKGCGTAPFEQGICPGSIAPLTPRTVSCPTNKGSNALAGRLNTNSASSPIALLTLTHTLLRPLDQRSEEVTSDISLTRLYFC